MLYFLFLEIDGSGDDLESSGDKLTEGSGGGGGGGTGGVDDEDVASGSGSGMIPEDEVEPRTTKRPPRNEFEFVNTRGPKYNTPKDRKDPSGSGATVSLSFVLLVAVFLQFVVRRWL